MQKTIYLMLLMGSLPERRSIRSGAKDAKLAKPSPQPAFCSAVRGVRAEGWPAQSRSEVMAQHGMVVTSQPLAAQAGLQILQHGGNAIDAAVATAAVLNVMEPMMVGIGGDLFAIDLHRQGTQGLCAERQRHGAHRRNRRAIQ